VGKILLTLVILGRHAERQRMTQFFFHIRDGEMFDEDSMGVDLPNLDAARREATCAAREMMAEQVEEGLPIIGRVMNVCDEDGTMVFQLAFKDLLDS
jgi:hypothetical protein